MTDTIYFIAPTPAFLSRTLTGAPNVNGTVTTYKTGTVIPKATYADSTGDITNTNPVQLDGSGEAVIYWASNELYTIVEKDVNGTIIRTTNNYPVVGITATPEPTSNTLANIVRNAQFTFWSNANGYESYSKKANNYDFVCDDWLFDRSNLNATIAFTRQLFGLGQHDVPANPVYYFKYNCANAGAGAETFKYLYQNYSSVTTLSEQEVTLSFYAKIDALTEGFTVDLTQFFGTGGSPSSSVSTTFTLTPDDLSTSWQKFTGTITLPSVTSKSRGDNGDDCLQLRFNFPLNDTCIIDICNIQLQIGDQELPFPYLTLDDQYRNLDSQISYATFTSGDVKLSLRNSTNQPDPGWLYMNDGTIGDSSSGSTTVGNFTKSLFKIIWNNVNSTIWAPIFDSSGNVTTYGADAETDYNSHKRISLTKALGRVLGGAGQSIITKTFTADSGTEQLLIDNTSSFYTGTPVTVANSGGELPSPLAPATTYYVINIDSTHIQLATTLANAIAGTAINITTNGTGTNSIFITDSTWVLGQYVGEENHLQLRGEVGVHSHSALSTSVPVWTGTSLSGTAASGGNGGTQNGSSSVNTTVSDSATNSAANIMQPTSFYNVMIKL